MRYAKLLTVMVTLLLVALWGIQADAAGQGKGKSSRIPAPVSQTGMTICTDDVGAEIPCEGTGQDGEYQMGVPWLDPRFSDRGDGTVRDNLTGLIWLKDASCTSFFASDNTGLNYRTWSLALTAANSLASDYCGLSDGSVAGDWRLPNVRELESLVDYNSDGPSLPEIHPFTGLNDGGGRYWSSTPSGPYALIVNFYFGYPDHEYKDQLFYVWPVRGAN